MLLTHAHIDHSGMLPKLYKDGFRGKVYATQATENLSRIMLMDSAHIQQSDAEWMSRKAVRAGRAAIEPVYTTEDAAGVLRLMRPCSYAERIKVAEGVELRFTDVGHLLGSACVELWLTENGETRKIVFSGDVGNTDQPILSDPLTVDEADYLVIESTYGNRLHEKAGDTVAELAAVLQRAFDRGGSVIVPAFAVGRTQELLYAIREIKQKRLVQGHDGWPVYLDSPLAIEATHIYHDTLRSYFDSETNELLNSGINPIGFDGLHLTVTSDESRQINTDPTPKVIISASGMCEAGRIRHHLKHNLWRPECTVLFVGYQVEGTLGRKLLEGAKYVNLFGEEVRVSAAVRKLDGISAHADADGLPAWIMAMREQPQRVYVNHGADAVCDKFAETIRLKAGIEATAPYSGDVYDPVSGTRLADGSRRKVRHDDTDGGRRFSAVWAKLYAAGMRLMRVIERSRNCKSKDLIVLTNRINALCDRQEKEIPRK